jgi:hypothetical protein
MSTRRVVKNNERREAFTSFIGKKVHSDRTVN